MLHNNLFGEEITPIQENFLERQKVLLNDSLKLEERKEKIQALDLKLNLYIQEQNKMGNGSGIPLAIKRANFNLNQAILKRNNIKIDCNSETLNFLNKNFPTNVENMGVICQRITY